MEEEKITSNLEEGCIHCLNYFAIFNYPLTVEEVHLFNTVKSSQDEINLTLEKLYEKKQVYKIESFFLTESNPDWIKERLKGNKRALELLDQSGKYVKIIASFPFVRGIAISGSLSKFYASDRPDIDYFIIVDENRLWIARTLLHLFKKLTFITGHQHYFCMNYFVDTNSLKITHQNHYSAIETVTLLPVYNNLLIKKFLKNNTWVNHYLPNFGTQLNTKYLVKDKSSPIKKLFELLINILAPERLNRFFMNLTDKKWRRKWKKHDYSEDDYNRAFQTDISISKNHPADFEKKVLSELAESKNEKN